MKTNNSTTETTDHQITSTIDPPTLVDVKETVTANFDDRTWEATEAVLAAHSTLLLQDNSCVGLVLTGPSGSGKTTVLRFFEELDEMFYRTDDVTPASFVSHDASKKDETLEEIDLLPRIKQKSLLALDLSNWFAGEEESITKRMAVMTNVLDGEGYTRDTGTHGQRGYTGSEYRFNFIGATTPLAPRAWRVMGSVGNRLVFYERPGTTDSSTVVDDVVEGSPYDEKVAQCQNVVQAFLLNLWEQSGGPGSKNWNSPTSAEIKEILGYLMTIITHGRAPVFDDRPRYEGAHRITSTLWAIARGHALLDGRSFVNSADLQVCARIALSTISTKRRDVVRGLLNPANGGTLTASEVERLAGVTRPTAHERMRTLVTLEFATFVDMTEDGRAPKVIELMDDLEWPESLTFPEF